MGAKIVALIGYAGVGKTEVANYLVLKHGFTHLKFASGLKDMLRALGLGERSIEGDLKERKSTLLCGKTPRHAMITLGTEWGRNCIGEDLWVNVLQRKIESLKRVNGDGLKVVVDDCRFLNEGTMLRDMGAKVWRITRPGVEAKIDHPSEKEHLNIHSDFGIHNYRDKESLYKVVDNLVMGEANWL